MKNRVVRKPKVADINQLNAENNILCKINSLEAWAKNGIPYAPNGSSEMRESGRLLEYFPCSVRQFNFWDGSQNSSSLRGKLPSISRNANDTLRRHPNLRLRLEEVLSALVVRAASQSDESKPLRIKKLTNNLALEKSLRTIAETALLVLREEMKALQRKHANFLISSDSTTNELKRRVCSLESQLEQAEQEISDLKRRLIKVSPIKKV